MRVCRIQIQLLVLVDVSAFRKPENPIVPFDLWSCTVTTLAECADAGSRRVWNYPLRIDATWTTFS